MSSYGFIDLDQHCFKQWLVAWWHRALSCTDEDVDGSVEERRNSSALTMELRLSCTKPSIYCQLNPLEQTPGKFQPNMQIFFWKTCIWECFCKPSSILLRPLLTFLVMKLEYFSRTSSRPWFCIWKFGAVRVNWINAYRQISNIRRTKSQTLNVSCLVLQLSLPNPLKPGIKSRMKI